MNETLHPARRGGRLGRTIARPGAVLGAAVAVAAIAAGCGSGSGTKADTATTNPNATAATRSDLTALGRSLKQPIFWVGPAAGKKLESTSTGDGRILVRYLAPSAPIGADRAFTTVGTYTVPNAYAAAQRAASKPGAVKINVTTSAIAFSTKAHPLSAWITYPGSRFQVEVFDPVPGRARSLVASGKVVRIPGTPVESRPVVVSAKSLAKVATTAKRPIYWAGPQPNQTYELTRRQGSFLLRYLQPGTTIGVTTPQLTVGTYPVPNAMAAIKRLSLAKGASTIKLTGGGIAVLNPRFPKSIYIAYPGSNYEIEVFDPLIAHARQLVTSGRITAVP